MGNESSTRYAQHVFPTQLISKQIFGCVFVVCVAITVLARLIKENGGSLSAAVVFKLKQAERECTVPIACHPMTAACTKTKASVWSTFTTGSTATTRLGTDSSSSDGEDPANKDVAHAVVDKLISLAEELVAEEDSSRKRQRSQDKTSINAPRMKSKVVVAKSFVDILLLPLLKDLNTYTKRLPEGHTREHATQIYQKLCAKNNVLQSKTVQNYFKVDQFIKCAQVIFPETASANIVIRFFFCFLIVLLLFFVAVHP